MPRRWSALGWCAAGLVLASVLLTACNQEKPKVETSLPAGPPVTVTITRTGGIAGVNEEITIAPSGAWSYSNRRPAKTEAGRLTEAELAQLTRLAHDPGLAEEAAKTRPGQCNDGFLYNVSVGGSKLSFEDCGARSEQPTFEELLRLITAATAM